MSAKGYDKDRVVSETKVETTGVPVSVELTPDRATINADGEDVSVFTVAVKDAEGRVVPTATNKIHFELAGAGHIIGVGNGDPSCHEPDTYVAQPQTQSIPVQGWRWKLGELPRRREIVPPETAVDFDDSSWPALTLPPAPGPSGVVPEGEAAIFRTHLPLTKEELANPGVQLRFAGLGDHGLLYVNGQRIAETHDWMPQPPFEMRQVLARRRQRHRRFCVKGIVERRLQHRRDSRSDQRARDAAVPLDAQRLQRPGASYRAINERAWHVHAHRHRRGIETRRRPGAKPAVRLRPSVP